MMKNYIQSPEPPDGNWVTVIILIAVCLLLGFALGFGAAMQWWVP